MMRLRRSQPAQVFERKLSRSGGPIPESTKSSVQQRLEDRRRERWPRLKEVRVRFRGRFAYVDAIMPDGDLWSLCRLRYVGYANEWGFAFYAASSEKYEDSILPSGAFAGTVEEALDCSCGTYLGDPSAWVTN